MTMARESKPHLHKGYWRCRIDGREVHLGADKRAAFAKFHQLMTDRLAEDLDDRPRTVNGVIAAWLKLNDKPGYADWLAQFREFAGDVSLRNVEKDLLTRYHLHLKDQTGKRRVYDRKAKAWGIGSTGKALSPKTQRHYIRAATAVLKWAHEQEWLDVLPVTPKVPKPIKQARDLDTGAIIKALDTFATKRARRAGRILRFIAETGCRPSEACHLEWQHVQLDRLVCILPEHKTAESTGQPRTIYITPGALDVLRGIVEDRRLSIAPLAGPVFTTGDGRPYKPSGLRSIMRRHFGGATPYQLRHAYAQRNSDNGMRVDDLAKQLGHVSTETTAFYYQVRDARAVEAAKTVKPLAAAAG
jgi:integrase